MLYQIHADMGRTEDVDLDGDGVPETRRPEIKIMTVEAGSGDEAAAKAMTMGAKFVRGVAPSSQQRIPEPATPASRADLTAKDAGEAPGIAAAASALDKADVRGDMFAIDTNDPAAMAELARIVAKPVVPRSAAADLLARADSMPFLSFKSLAAKILGPEMPGTKAEIIVALHAKAA